MPPTDAPPDTLPAALIAIPGTAEPEHAASPWDGLLAGFRGVTRAAAIAGFLPYTVGLEGAVGRMYCDRKGLVTAAIGNLLDFGNDAHSIAAAQRLPWLRADGTAATPDDVAVVWRLVKSHQELTQHGGAAYCHLPGNDIHLDRAGVAQAVCLRLEENDRYLADRFAAFPSWPADAQLGTHSLAWAAGPAAHYPKFSAFVNADPPDFAGAATECHLADGAPRRNAAQVAMFENAARVIGDGLDPDVLLYAVPVPDPGNWIV